MNSDEPIKIDLTPAEQDLLVQGLAQWGAGTDWPITTGLSDQETITALRTVQKKIGHALHPVRPTA